MDRREALRRTALLLGGVISAPTLAGVLAGCEAPRRTGAENFLGARPEQQVAILTELDGEAYQQGPTSTSPQAVPFFRTMKELTLLGYYTSEVGATKELHYNPEPGRFEECVPMSRVGRAINARAAVVMAATSARRAQRCRRRAPPASSRSSRMLSSRAFSTTPNATACPESG